MGATSEPAGWTSDFRELVGTLDAELHDLTALDQSHVIYDRDEYAAAQSLAKDLREQGANGIVYQSVRFPEGGAVAVFWPDIAGIPIQGQHFSYYWNGSSVTLVKNLTTKEVFEVITGNDP